MQRLCTRSLYEISVTSSLEEFSWQDLCKRPLGKTSATDLHAVHALSLCKVCRRGVLARSLYKICIRGLLARSLQGASWQDHNKSLCNGSAQDLFMKSPLRYKLSRRVLLARFMYETSWQDLCNRSPCSPCTVSVQGLQKRCPGKISVQDLYKRSLGKISARGVLARSQQISMQRLCTRSLYEISVTSSLEEFSWQDLCKRPLGKTSATDLHAVHALSLCKVCRRGVLARSLYKICIRGLLARSLQGASWQDHNKSLCNGSAQDLFMKSPLRYKLSRRVLLARFMYETSWQDLCNRSPCTVSVQGQGLQKSWQDLCTRAVYEVSW